MQGNSTRKRGIGVKFVSYAISTSQGNKDLVFAKQPSRVPSKRCSKERSTSSTARSMTFISISVHIESPEGNREEESRCSVISKPSPPPRNYSRIVPPFGSRRQKCLLLFLVRFGIFFHPDISDIRLDVWVEIQFYRKPDFF